MAMMNQSTSLRSGDALPPETLDDETLLARMKQDDGEAYRVLVERHVDRAYALALRMLRNVADAEDVAQDSMVKAWTHRQSWEPGRARFSTWLYRVVVNRCIDLRRLPNNANIDDVPEPAEHRPDTVDSLHRREVYGRLEQAIGKLPDQQRAAVTLAYFEEMGNGEIAQVLGTTVSAVESLLKRGRQGLRHSLRGSEAEFRHLLAQE
ncbi:RNA polymerase sigma factor [Magnetospirillum fulvum]|jgi:RNA polymerase sigma-70 factor (ECF subfamily)|uniref:RNA polymerase sigma factor n=1 Tax=Magnetospirillum fulvum MGU-K5 TaxID=1316936 RepID=S9S8H6_MAGFU|nr:RNA polymerase sigma factor [Magnetospirillum fulvum]EPY02192.1 RNA polymerase sigma factor [Magnetospirillum fulvum MGU-K5]